MNDPQQGVLNLDSINCLRTFAGIGTVVWGARTLVANNQAYQQSMYVPVRRMTLFIEQTLLANLRWVVFEPNDEPLWIAITRLDRGVHAVAVPPGRAAGLDAERGVPGEVRFAPPRRRPTSRTASSTSSSPSRR